MTTTGPGGSDSKILCRRCPRSPLPCGTRVLISGNMALGSATSGLTASTVCQRGSRPSRATTVDNIARYAAVAATVPIPSASRVLTRPATGSLTMMTRRGAKLTRGAKRFRDASSNRHEGVSVAVLLHGASPRHAVVIPGHDCLIGDDAIKEFAPRRLGRCRI